MNFVPGDNSDWSVIEASHIADKVGVDLGTGISTRSADRPLDGSPRLVPTTYKP